VSDQVLVLSKANYSCQIISKQTQSSVGTCHIPCLAVFSQLAYMSYVTAACQGAGCKQIVVSGRNPLFSSRSAQHVWLPGSQTPLSTDPELGGASFVHICQLFDTSRRHACAAEHTPLVRLLRGVMLDVVASWPARRGRVSCRAVWQRMCSPPLSAAPS
jgi:hypothetical protein